MEYGPFYSLDEIAHASELILSQLDKVDIGFFTKESLPYDRKDILTSIHLSKQLEWSDDHYPVVSHPAIHQAIEASKLFEDKSDTFPQSPNELFSTMLFTDLSWLTETMINHIFNIYEKNIEKILQDIEYREAIKMLTIERQSNKFESTHPRKFISRYRDFLNKRIKDLKELLEIEKLDFSSELKEIIESYKLGLEVNVKGRNLLSPLLSKDYDTLVENLKNILFIPSYFDIPKNEKEKYFHVYLLGVLEGRLNLYNLKSNKESGFGRYDICAFPLKRNNPGLLIEIKSDKTANVEAIRQIKSNNYVNELRIDGVKEVLALAINFQPKEISTAFEIIRLD